MLSPKASVTVLKGVGARVAERLNKLGIETLQDLLFHLPSRYQDRSRITPIIAARHGAEVVIQGEVELTEIKFSKRRMLLVRLSDSTGMITLRFFHFSNAQRESMTTGRIMRCFGEIRDYQGAHGAGSGNKEIAHPEYSFVNADEALDESQHLTPIYPTTDGVNQLTLRNLLKQLVPKHNELNVDVPDYLDQSLLNDLHFPTLHAALAFCHMPPTDSNVDQLNNGEHECQLRLAFEELLAQHMSLKRLRQKHQQHTAPSLPLDSKSKTTFESALPFALTNAQQKVLQQISSDLQQNYPMLRLVQGDVGSGKTVVAAMAAIQAVQAGYQVLIMAPTEILAEQHSQCFLQWFKPLNISTGLLTGKQSVKIKRPTLEALASGDLQVAIGTHALFQEGVEFNKVGLIIVDEQHRFGVHQRLALRNKSLSQAASDEIYYPHQLIMTATPIPRTLMMTAYADLDCSIIDELPPGRTPVETAVISNSRRDDVLKRVHDVCRQGRQAYWVCTLIEESEALQCQAAETTAQLLQTALTDLTVGLIHGRMNSSEKVNIMAQFSAAKIDLLVATTVIEVGVDVPNSTLMIIENAERLGLSQLHQLRGRVGRGSDKSHCVLMYQTPVSKLAKARLAAMRETNDGFLIAKYDLELRGPGEMLGTRQTGLAQFRIADLTQHQHLLTKVSVAAKQLENVDTTQIDRLIQRWIGDKKDYGHV